MSGNGTPKIAADVIEAIDEITARAVEIDAEGEERGAAFARFYGFDAEWELQERDSVRIAQVGGLSAIAIRCARESEEADLRDIVGCRVGRVINDGSIVWKE